MSNVGDSVGVGNEQDYQEDDSDLTGKMGEKTMAEEIGEKEAEKKEAPVKIFKRKIPKKTKLEKSIEVLSNGFCAAAEKETEMMMKLEQMRHKEMLEHEIRLKKLGNERRREERQHELLLLNLLSQNQNQAPPQEVTIGQNMMYGKRPISHIYPPASAGSQDETFRTYFKL